ncbi:hypothetical protein [Pseudomonas sp. ZB1P45]|uniref:hypothetical protein n=1 Tax=Pseudomonas frigoris TaxID=3398356 RepID=UPI0039EF9999
MEAFKKYEKEDGVLGVECSNHSVPTIFVGDQALSGLIPFLVSGLRSTGAKLPGDFADIQVRNCLGPDDFFVVSLEVFGHAFARMAGRLPLTVVSLRFIAMPRSIGAGRILQNHLIGSVLEWSLHVLSVNGCLQGSFSNVSKGPPCCC